MSADESTLGGVSVLLEERIGRVAMVTLNRPEVLNALNPELMREFRRTVAALANDDTVGCVVVTGAGRGFCAGGDMRASKVAQATDAEAPAKVHEIDPDAELQRRADWINRSAQAARLLCEMAKPTIAMVNGPCAGAGLSIAGACDMRFSADDASFVSGFSRIGMPGDYGGTWYWTRILGTGKARQLYMLSEKMTAADALAFGLVDRAFPGAELRARTLEIAQALAALPPSGLALAKENLNAACIEPLDTFLARESRNMVLGRRALTAWRAAQKAG